MGDNVLLVNEVMIYINRVKILKINFVVMKLDINKVYNRVDWDFFRGILKKFIFLDKWIIFIMECIIFVLYVCFINGCLFDFLKFKCGLR